MYVKHDWLKDNISTKELLGNIFVIALKNHYCFISLDSSDDETEDAYCNIYFYHVFY